MECPLSTMGRESNLTGRTEIWAAVLPLVPNPAVGAGFESFWLPPRLEKVWTNLSGHDVLSGQAANASPSRRPVMPRYSVKND